MTDKEIAENRMEFTDVLKRDVNRAGVDDLLWWLGGTDFFHAPSSTSFHLSEPGGLCQHSLNVRRRMLEEVRMRPNDYPGVTQEEVTLVSLCHDLCKTGLYETYFRNVKDDTTGKWEKVQCYRHSDDLPLGHGEKSLYIVQRFLQVTEPEAMAIRWHMGAFDDAVRGGFRNLSAVYSRYPLAYALHQADEKATYFDEA